MKKDNKGFSLVELIVVMAIAMIVTGVVVTNVAAGREKAADECVEKIESTLQGMRITTMGKYDAYMEIYVSGDSVYANKVMILDAAGSTSSDLTIVGGKGVSVTYEIGNSGSFISLDSTPVRIAYDRSSGAFTTDITAIRAQKGARVKTIKLNKATGKIQQID